MAHHVHLRFTPSSMFVPDLSGFMLFYPTIVCSHEGAVDKKGIYQAEHYHLFYETDECQKTCRNKVIEYFKIPKSGRGQGNKHYCLKYDAYKEPSPEYICKYGDIVYSSGYDQEFIEKCTIKGEAKYAEPEFQVDNQIAKAKKIVEEADAAEASAEAARTKSQWSIISEAFNKKEYAKNMSMSDICRFIKAFYLSKGQPIPRAGDTRRYAYSLYAICQGLTDYNDIPHVDAHELTHFANNS